METQSTQIHNFHAGDRFHEHYRLLEHVGSGGFADVWKAKDELVDTIVALKIYTRLDKEGISELAKEYKQMKGVKHPNLLTGNHFDASGNIPYLEMDYCDGGSLVRKVGEFSNDELRHVAQDIAKGLAYLHSEGIVHQDIKPENILYDTAHKRYLLSDFGISSKSRTRLSHSVNKSNMTLSMTEAYAPPEKFSGNMSGIAPDTKGDIFSLGMTLFELTVGKLPFDPPMATGREMFYSQGRLRLDYSKIKDAQLRKIIEACTKYSKAERPTAEALLMKLAASKQRTGERQAYDRPPTRDNNNSDTYGKNSNQKRPTDPINKQKPPTEPIYNYSRETSSNRNERTKKINHNNTSTKASSTNLTERWHLKIGNIKRSIINKWRKFINDNFDKSKIRSHKVGWYVYGVIILVLSPVGFYWLGKNVYYVFNPEKRPKTYQEQQEIKRKKWREKELQESFNRIHRISDSLSIGTTHFQTGNSKYIQKADTFHSLFSDPNYGHYKSYKITHPQQ